MESTGWGRLLSVLWAPVRTYQSIAHRPTWLPPLVAFLIVGAGVGWLANAKIDPVDLAAETREALEGSGATAEDIEETLAMQERVAGPLAVAGAVVLHPLFFALAAFLLWSALRVAGGEWDFRTAFSVSLHGLIPGALLAPLFALPVLLSRPTIPVAELRHGILASNLALFAPEGASPRLLAALSSFDVFSLWTVVLLAVGSAIAARVPGTVAAISVAGLWGLYILGKVGMAGAFF